MEQFSLLILFVAMLALWWWSYASGRKDATRDTPPQDRDEQRRDPRP